MRSFIAVALLLVCAAVATPSVKLPNGFSTPENAKLTGAMLYNSLAYSQNTLSHGVDVSLLATNPAAQTTLVGSTAKHPATLVVIPEELAPKDASGALADNAFPLMEMSLTLSTAVVQEGISEEMQEALYYDEVRKIVVKRDIKMIDLISSLDSCGVELSEKKNGFALNGAFFDSQSARDVLYAAAVACSSDFNEQVTIVDLRSAYDYTKNHYSSDPAQLEAVEKMIRSVVEFLSGKTISFVLATDDDFFENQPTPSYDFAVVSPHLNAEVGKYVHEKVSSPSTGIFHITMWFTIFIVIVVVIFTLLTCGVGIDIEKDTLLYQTTALRGQPVL